MQWAHVCIASLHYSLPQESDLFSTSCSRALLSHKLGLSVHFCSCYMHQTMTTPQQVVLLHIPLDVVLSSFCLHTPGSATCPLLMAPVLCPAGLMQLLATAHTTSLMATSRASWLSTCSPRRCAHHVHVQPAIYPFCSGVPALHDRQPSRKQAQQPCCHSSLHVMSISLMILAFPAPLTQAMFVILPALCTDDLIIPMSCRATMRWAVWPFT